jgi:LPXTG-motif cell wall-anchored protein
MGVMIQPIWLLIIIALLAISLFVVKVRKKSK